MPPPSPKATTPELAPKKVPLAKAPIPALLKALPRLGGELWFGLYMMKSKVGYFSQSWRLKEERGERVVVNRQHMHVEIKNMMGKKVITMEIINRFKTEGEGLLLSQVVTQNTPMEHSRYFLEHKGGRQYQFTMEKRLTRTPSTPRTETKTLTFPPLTLVNSELALLYLISQKRGRLEGPTRWRIRKFLHTHAFVTHEVLTLKSAKSVSMAGVQSILYSATAASDKPRSSVEVSLDQGGRILQSKLGYFIVKRETKKIAQNFNVTDDLGFMAMIPANLKQFTRQSRALQLTLSGPFPKGVSYLNTARYKVKVEKNRVTMTLTKDSTTGLALPTPLPKKVQQYTTPSVGIESDHKLIKKMAHTAVRSATQGPERVRRLTAYVHKLLIKTMWADFDSAVSIAKERKGDCTEHSLLFTALARSLGIPARRVGGVGYVELQRDKFAFGYHMWAQVWLGRWIDVDPTWGQFPADASHILMGDDLDTQWVMSIGALKLLSYTVLN